MATSNSYDYTIDRDTLIRTAFENIGVAVEGEALDSEDITVAARALNMLIKAWTVHGLQVWKRKTYAIDPLVADKKFYDLGVNETNTVVVTGDGTTTVTVTHAYHGYATGDSIAIAGATDDTDINGTFTITVTDPSTYTYTALAAVDSGVETGATTATKVASLNIPRPERVLSVELVDSAGNETSLSPLTRDEYDSLSNKSTSGNPNSYHYERTLGAGRLYIWPTADSSAVTDYTISITYQAPIEDLDSSTDSLDFPQEWMEPLSINLAYKLSSKYGYPLQERYLLRKDAQDSLKQVLDYDIEDGSIFFQPAEYM